MSEYSDGPSQSDYNSSNIQELKNTVRDLCLYHSGTVNELITLIKRVDKWSEILGEIELALELMDKRIKLLEKTCNDYEERIRHSEASIKMLDDKVFYDE